MPDERAVQLGPIRQLLLAQSQFLTARTDVIREYAPEL